MSKLPNYRLALACILLAMTIVSAYPSSPTHTLLEKSEMRCGWFSNPTPANASLFDRDGEWIIGVQGGHYGYGCACLRVRVDRAEQRILVIESAQARALSVCRRDPALRKFGFK